MRLKRLTAKIEAAVGEQTPGLQMPLRNFEDDNNKGFDYAE
jgi:hypothetical protein